MYTGNIFFKTVGLTKLY